MNSRLLLFFFFLTILYSCRNQQVQILGEAQGTYYAITYFYTSDESFKDEIDSLLADFDLSVSTYEPSSVISKVNNNDTSVRLDEIFIDIFNKAVEVSDNTNGAFDMTIGPLVNAWGFGFSERIAMDSVIVDSLLQLVDYKAVTIAGNNIHKEVQGIQIDFNAIAQGYSVDYIASFLESKGIKTYLIDIGGEVYAKGLKPGGEPWKVGIEKPARDKNSLRELKAILGLTNAALATSGSYRKYYMVEGIKYSHTINPATGYPVTHSLLSVTVKAEDCCSADAYATAFMVMGLEETKRFLSQHSKASSKGRGMDVFLIYNDSLGELQTYLTEGMRELMISELD
ncbi:MAG: FAD:protein FMN transferase [Bacteroidales bacterium]|nr:FAD:protein FMN transferase [Bacteroidales bacterium]